MKLQDFEHDLYIKLLAGVKQKHANKDTSEFSVPDFFSDNEWSVVPDPSRMKLGKIFKQKVDDNLIQNVVFCNMSKKNWAVYKIIF